MKDYDFISENNEKQLMFLHLINKFKILNQPDLFKYFLDWKNHESSDGFGRFLLSKNIISNNQYEILASIQKFLYTRHADRQFSEMILETGHVSRDEIEYAFKGQEEFFKNGYKIKRIGDLLIEYGSITENLRNELLQQQGRALDD
ncbi:hypothetical protein KKF91_14705 [Myxococcota bacterium]|nr:hypothetical protein [Myxococcota bacterium]MBU1896673.1 hypothetical protein [Myxococcota bacterium]